MKIMIWLLVVPGLLWALLRLVGWDHGPLVQLFAFTTYMAVLAWVPAIVALAGRHWIAGGVAVVSAGILTACVLPRALPGQSPRGGVELRVMTSNMLHGDADPATVVRLVKENDVEVLAVQEFTPQAQAALGAAGLGALLPYVSSAAEVGTTGSGLYSRFPIAQAGALRNGGGFMQAYGTIEPPGATALIVESAHPNAPYAVSALHDWRGDLQNQPQPDPHGEPRILLGDFNATLDHAEMRALLGSGGYHDAAATVGKGLVPTWGFYYGHRKLPPVTIDHVLLDERIGVRDVQVHRIPKSDHRAVLAWLTVPAK